MAERTAVELSRETRETRVRIAVGVDATRIDVGVPIFAHFLGALVRTWGVAVAVRAEGDVEVDPHHLIEDVGIVFGQALRGYLPGYRDIARYGFALVPMDDALAEAALDLSGRAGSHLGAWPKGVVGGVQGEAFAEFFHGLCRGAECTLHLTLRAGDNRHHCIEAAFKALGLSLRAATAPRDGILSTKGVIA